MTVSNKDELDDLVARVKKAQAEYESYSQEQVDRIFRAAARVAFDARLTLAQAAVEETGLGMLEDKVAKNVMLSEYIYYEYKDTPTCGIVEYDRATGFHKIAEPYGLIAAIVPVTNPTSTAIFKCMLALKTRNGVILAPHPRGKGCTAMTAQLILDAAVAAGAPPDIIGWIDQPSIDLTQALMTHPQINLILATGGPGLVKAAYSSGKPALGVGAGNTPVVIDESADIQAAANAVIMGKTFDSGMICASEQAVFAVDEVYDRVREEFVIRGCHVLSPAEKAKLDKAGAIMQDGHLNGKIVGKLPVEIAALGGVKIPESSRVLVAECDVIDPSEPFCREKMSPTLALYRARDFEDAVEKSRLYLSYGGAGHTAALHTNQSTHVDRIQYFGLRITVSRLTVNQPATLGAMGGIFNVNQPPTMTLGCGSWGGNSVSENVGVKHVMNTKRILERRDPMQCYRVPPRIYFNPDCLPLALKDLAGKQRAMVVTDRDLYGMGFHTQVTDALSAQGIESRVYFDVESRPSVETVLKGGKAMEEYQPDVIIALGGGSAIDAAKVMWVFYEHPEAAFEDVALGFTDMRKRIIPFPKLRNKATLVTIPTTSGSGAEVSPGAVIRNAETNMDYLIADYELTPDMAIVDPQLVMEMPKALTATSGLEAVSHAIESFASAGVSDYTSGHSLEAARLLFDHLPSAYAHGGQDPQARARVHYAASLSGLAMSNSFLGLSHGMAHALGVFNVPLGVAQAICLPHVILYNSADAPTKQHPLLTYPHAKDRYAELADHLKLGGRNKDEKLERLIKAVEKLVAACDLPATIQKAGVPEAAFLENLPSLVALALGDVAAGGNPRQAMAKEVGALFMTAFYGAPPAVVETPPKSARKKKTSSK